jgi:hypothetical protein
MSSCANGFICLDKQYVGLVLLGAIVIASYYMIQTKSEMVVEKINKDLQNTKTRFLNYAIDQKAVSNNMYNLEHDYQRIVNPLVPPERSYPYRPLRAGLPININTRGPSSGFQQMGFLKETLSSGETKLLPLYGEQTYPGSNQYRYYTNTDGFQSVKLPITNKNKDCMDEYGCDELYDGNNITVSGYDKDYTVQLYKIDRPRYNPFVI